jgi:hypothetical protein
LLVEALIKAIEQRKMRNSERCFASSLAAEVEGEHPKHPSKMTTKMPHTGGVEQ